MMTLDEVVGFQPVRAKSGKEIRLAMQRLYLVGRVLPVGARLMVQHTFRSDEENPLEVIYSFALPRDAALRRFRVSGKGFSVHSQLKPVDEAVKAYEEGIEQGHLSTLARQYRDGVVNLSLGNLQPEETVTVYLEMLAGVETHDRGFRFRFPFTLAPSYHSKARSVAIDEGTGEIELPEDEFGDVILPQFNADADNLHQVGFDLSVSLAQPIEEIVSPSHSVRFSLKSHLGARVSLAQAHDVPNRDLVLEVRTRQGLSGTLAGIGNDGKGHFAAVFPSETFGKLIPAPRRVVFVMDRSGSMGGAPIEQAKKAIEACLGALSEQDQFSMVAFDDRPESFKTALVPGNMENRESLRRFLKGMGPRGGTELAKGFAEAARMFGKEGGDVMLLTDGQVFGTEDILEKARAACTRIHCLGIGSASQDRFLSLLSEQTGGVCRFLTPRERVDLPAVDLFASIGRPIATNVQIKTENLPEATILPEPQSMVFSGNPLVVYGETSGESEGQLNLEWETGNEKRTMVQPVIIRKNSIGETIRLLRGAKLITDAESCIVGSPSQGEARKREDDRLAKRLKSLSQTYGLVSRQMALVAVVERKGDKPGQLPQTTVVPVGMPQDVSFTSYFANQAHSISYLGAPQLSRARPFLKKAFYDLTPEAMLSEETQIFLEQSRGAPLLMPDIDRNEELLLELACRIEPDGGMPGKDDDQRLLATLAALILFVSEGHTLQAGAFRTHVQRLTAFLQSYKTKSLPDDMNRVVERVTKAISNGQTLPGDWSRPMHDLLKGKAIESVLWRKIEKALDQA